MQNDRDDDLAPTVNQPGDVKTEGFSEPDENVRDEKRDDAGHDSEHDDKR